MRVRLLVLFVFSSFLRVPLSAYQVRELLGAHTKSVYEAVHHLRDRGMIEEFGSDGRTVRYRLSELGLESLTGILFDSDLSPAKITSFIKRASKIQKLIRESLRTQPPAS